MHYIRLQVAEKKALRTWRKYHPEVAPQRYPHSTQVSSWGDKYEMVPCIGTYRKTKVLCSNPGCCGNPRKRGEISVQEKKAPSVQEWQ